MRVRFWGVRGALAATGPESLGAGGNTPCVEVRDARGTLLVLDAGIGLYWLGRALLAGPHGRGRGKVTLLLSNTHWDHIQGFPFFVPAFIPGNEVQVWGGGAAHIEYILEGQLNPTYSPLASLQNLGASVQVRQLEHGQELKVGALRIRHAVLMAGTDSVIGYRIQDGARSLCYVPRVAHGEAGPDPAFAELCRGADVLIHEAHYTAEERTRGGVSLGGRGAPAQIVHSTYEDALRAALAVGARQLLFFYHHPDRDDAALDAQVTRAREQVRAAGQELRVDAAREGVELQV